MRKDKLDLTKKVHNILIVDDEAEERRALFLTLLNTSQFKSKISTAEDSKTALDEFEKQNFDLILADYRIPGMDGIELLNKIKEKYPKTIRMLITGYSDFNIAKNAINKANVHNFIEKPWSNDELTSIISKELIRKTELETKSSTEVDNVEEALSMLNEAQQEISQSLIKQELKRMLMLEFKSEAEFNKFFFKIKQMKNINIDDMHIFENRYIMKLSVYRRSYGKII